MAVTILKVDLRDTESDTAMVHPMIAKSKPKGETTKEDSPKQYQYFAGDMPRQRDA